MFITHSGAALFWRKRLELTFPPPVTYEFNPFSPTRRDIIGIGTQKKVSRFTRLQKYFFLTCNFTVINFYLAYSKQEIFNLIYDILD